MAEKAKNEKKEGFLKRVAHRFVKGCKDMKGEIKKVVWPSKKQIINNTAVVLACCIIVGVFMLFIVGSEFFISYRLSFLKHTGKEG